MAASFIEIARNKLLRTNVDVDGVHTLVVTAGSSGSTSYVELGRNKLFATDVDTVTFPGKEVHTLKVIEV